MSLVLGLLRHQPSGYLLNTAFFSASGLEDQSWAWRLLRTPYSWNLENGIFAEKMRNYVHVRQCACFWRPQCVHKRVSTGKLVQSTCFLVPFWLGIHPGGAKCLLSEFRASVVAVRNACALSCKLDCFKSAWKRSLHQMYWWISELQKFEIHQNWCLMSSNDGINVAVRIVSNFHCPKLAFV